MPFFDANKMVVSVDYDDNVSIVGQSLRGVVNIFVLEAVTLCGASIRYRVEERSNMRNLSAVSDDSMEVNDIYAIEYILFGNRASSKGQNQVIKVQPGHYSYPFALEVPQNAPPTQRFSASSKLQPLATCSAYTGAGYTICIEHLTEVRVYVANSLWDKQIVNFAPMVIGCTTPEALSDPRNGMEGHITRGASRTFQRSGIMTTLLSSFNSETKEQANCDLYIYNTVVALSDSPFLHFAVRGDVNCPYDISLIRRIEYTSASCRRHNEHIVGSVTLPPLNSPESGIRGRLIISPQALENSVTFTGKRITCSFYVTITLRYASGKNAAIREMDRVKIPIVVHHGTFAMPAVVGSDGAPVQNGIMGTVGNNQPIHRGVVGSHTANEASRPQEPAAASPYGTGSYAGSSREEAATSQAGSAFPLIDPEGDVALGDSPKENFTTIVLPYQSPEESTVPDKTSAPVPPRRPASAMHRPVGPVTDEDANNSAVNRQRTTVGQTTTTATTPAPAPSSNNQPEYNHGDSQPFNTAPNWETRK